jgi:glycyl-tRNA synthetase beta chain
LVLLIRDLAVDQEERVEEVKGPPAAIAFDVQGQPTEAAIGFARRQGVSVDSLTQIEKEGRRYAFLRLKIAGRQTVEILPEILPALVKGLRLSKAMRWDASGLSFVRPIRWLVCLFGDEVVPLSLGSLRADRITRPHRFLSQERLTLAEASTYEEELKKGLVIVDAEARQQLVETALSEAAHALGGKILLDPNLLGRIVNGAEHPTPVLGRVPAAFLDLPAEVVQATLREEGKFVPFLLPDGTTPSFMGFRDGLPDEKGIVRAGYERVVLARLRDSRFFFDKDRKHLFAERVRELRDMTYDVRLGSLWEKMERVRALAGEIAKRTGLGSLDLVDRAAFLCKADLVTEMVKAFPELQGVAGGIYAQLDKEPKEVAVAIREHYLPATFDGALPQSDAGVVISLADKLDTVTGALLVGEEPTGSRDPYGIKRQASNLIRLAMEKKIDLDLFALLDRVTESYATVEQKMEMNDVKRFLADRVRQILKQRYRIPNGVILAVSAGEMGNVYRLLRRAQVLDTWRSQEEFQGLSAAFARVRNITKAIEEAQFDPALFTEEAERILWREYLKAEGSLARLLDVGEYSEAIEHLLPLKGPIDRYFDDVLVMAKEENLRRNRLGFLRSLSDLFLRIGDFGFIEAVAQTSSPCKTEAFTAENAEHAERGSRIE